MGLMAAISQYWQIGVMSFLVSFVFTKLAVSYFPALGLMDRPHLYGKKRAPIPYYGGLAIFCSFLLCVLLFVDLTTKVWMLILAAFLIVVIGFLDDLYRVHPGLRLLGQLFSGGILVYFGVMIETANLPFFGEVYFGAFAGILTVLWLMTLVNSMNFIDGVSGLNSGVTVIAGLTLFFLSVNPLIHENLAAQAPVAILSLILSGVALGFVLFDFPKPMILMGDSGSTFFGFLIGSLAIFSGGKLATAFLVLGIPLLDMVWVVMRRIYERKKFWEGDLKHLHHRLLDLGWSDRRVVVSYLSVTFVLGFSAIFLVNAQQKLYMILAMMIFLILLFGVLFFLPKK